MSSLTWRALTEADAKAYIALSDAICDADGDNERVDEEEYGHYLTYPLNVPDLDDFQGVFDGDRMVAADWVCRASEAEPVHWTKADGGVHPDYRGRGIRTQLLQWHQDLARRIHERYFPGHRLELSIGALDSFRPQLSFLLRDAANGQIAGYLLSTFNEADLKATGVRDIHFSVIGTRREYRKRGVASTLIAHAVAQSRELGYQTASLMVDAENPTGALGVYERSGFECNRKYVTYNKVLSD